MLPADAAWQLVLGRLEDNPQDIQGGHDPGGRRSHSYLARKGWVALASATDSRDLRGDPAEEGTQLSRPSGAVARGVSTRHPVEPDMSSEEESSRSNDLAARCLAEDIRWQSWETLHSWQSASPSRLLKAVGHKAR